MASSLKRNWHSHCPRTKRAVAVHLVIAGVVTQIGDTIKNVRVDNIAQSWALFPEKH